MLDFMQAAVACRLNVIVSGGTGAGKTTLLNLLSSFISEKERIVTIEDAAELTLRQRHVVRLETRPPNIEGKGAVRQRQLVINALRMRPDRIIVGEVRGDEALDMLQAMNTGHDGSLTTVHANSARDALHRLDTMVAMANLNIPERAIRQQIVSAIQLVVHMSRMADGTRKVTSVTEITGMEGEVISMQDIFAFDRTGINAGGSGVRAVPVHRHPAALQRAAGDRRRPAAGRHVRARQGHPVDRGEIDACCLPVLVFGVRAAWWSSATYWALVLRPETGEGRRVRKRLRASEDGSVARPGRAWSGRSNASAACRR